MDEARPEDIDSFERQVTADPTNSYIWMQYIAFILENIGIDRARQVMERAIKRVPASTDDHKNLWIAYMNMEASDHTGQEFQKVV